MNNPRICLFVLLALLISCSDTEIVENGARELVIGFDQGYELRVGDKVNNNGFEIGKVSKIEISSPGKKTVATIEFYKNQNIPLDSKFILSTCDILGNKCIEIEYSKSNKYYSNRDTIIGWNALIDDDPNELLQILKARVDSSLKASEHLNQDSLRIKLDSTNKKLF